MTRALVLVAALAWFAPAGAQSLDRVEALTHEARVQEARAELLGWFEATAGARPAREDLQRALWLRGILTVDPSQAGLDFTRLAVEYPGGPYTDRALERLAQAAVARGDLGTARRHYDVLARDYPRSPARAGARAWLAEHGGAEGPPPPGARASDGGRRGAGETPDAGGRGTGPRPRGEPATQGDYAVQIGAFSEARRARAVVDRLSASGFDARLVRTTSTDLVRVRVGRFRDAAGATMLHERLRAAGFESMVVADAGAERPVGGG